MKFKKGKKVLSLVLAALMVLSVMPTSMLIQKANAATAFEGGKEVADGTWKGWTWSVFGNSTAVANNTIKENIKLDTPCPQTILIYSLIYNGICSSGGKPPPYIFETICNTIDSGISQIISIRR